MTNTDTKVSPFFSYSSIDFSSNLSVSAVSPPQMWENTLYDNTACLPLDVAKSLALQTERCLGNVSPTHKQST